ncbi:MAG: alpha-amylase family protein, partial [Saprospiraceae bacterium]
RILQTVLRQPDAENYNVDSLVKYMKKTYSNTLVVNGGGIVDYFQNNLTMANINPYLGKRDLLAEIVEGCHRANIKVIARVDFRGVDKNRYGQHPDWFAKDEQGGPVILNYTQPELYAPCYNSYYRNEHAVEFISLLMDKYKLDGIWHNSVNFHQTCYCDRCQAKYTKDIGLKIPVRASSTTDWERYYQWNNTVAEEHLSLMQGTVKKYGEDKAYAAEVFDLYAVEQQKHTGISLYSAARFFDFLVIVSFITENKAQVEFKDFNYPAAIIKFIKTLEPQKSPVILFGGNGTEHRYIYDSPLEIRTWMWEIAAAAGGYWNCYFNGSYPAQAPDARNAYINTDAYKFILDHQDIIRTQYQVTDIGILYSKPSAEQTGDARFAGSLKGILRLLSENHYQYGFVVDRNLDMEQLKKFKVLLLPNVTVLSDTQIKTIKDWVAVGGKIISTYQTSLYNESGLELQNFGLSEVFGVDYLNGKVNTEIDCYQKIIKRNELVKGMELTNLLHNGGQTLLTRAQANASVVTGYLPKIINQPPENAYPENWDSPNPILVMNTYGQGESIYFANEIDKLNYAPGHPDYDQLLKNSIDYLIYGNKILKTNAPASVHVYLNQSVENSHSYQLSLVNTSGNLQRPLRTLIPVHEIEVELPFSIKNVKLLYPSKDAKFLIKGKKIYINKLEDFVCLKVEQLTP